MPDFKQVSIMQGYQHSPTSILMEPAQEMHGAASTMKPRSVGTDALSLPVERPKLNLKPRSQPVELGESEKERKTVFGGARPRELVLKDRGVDATGNPEILAQTNRLNKPDALKIESKIERTEPSTAEGRNLKDSERKDNRSGYEKSDAQRNSRKDDNWRSRTGETEKTAVERLAEPETWRKPIEPPKPETPPGPRLGKAASALELAEAFSRSMSDSRVDNRYAKQRMIPGRTQLPFSRLTGTREVYSGSSQRQINGY
ncbi:hypothetical protein HPP92_000736 [Vanilla planifolia]|uniref:Uncharacterized protein n=1 Tax=Vanilla planifolia TaxID=51239 RepID=A0A835VHC3_VANPL|nr:hypothetical protein HPP92_000736 [Vanilla planifolia]